MSITQEKFYGDTINLTPTTGFSVLLSPEHSRVKVINATDNNLVVILPDVLRHTIQPGGPIFYIINPHATNSLAVWDFGEITQIGTVAPLGACLVILAAKATAQGTWYMRCAAYNTPYTFNTTLAGSSTTTLATTQTYSTATYGTPGPGAPHTYTLPPSEHRISEPLETRVLGREDASRLVAPLSPVLHNHKVSLVIGILNEPDLELTLYSMLQAGTRLPDEIIVVDDCSDTSSDLYGDLQARIDEVLEGSAVATKLITLERPHGVGAARDIGCKEATGDVIIVLDGHMRFQPEWLERLLVWHETYPEAILTPVSVSLTPEDGFWGTGAGLEIEAAGYKAVWLPMRSDVEETCPRVPMPMGACYVVSRCLLKAIGGWGPALRGWGRDEEYLAIRAWLLGYEVRCPLDVVIGHQYGREVSRVSRTGYGGNTHDRAWEVDYNNQMILRVVPENPTTGLGRLWAQGAGLRHPGTQKFVDLMLRRQYEVITAARTLIQRERIMTDREVLRKLRDVDHAVRVKTPEGKFVHHNASRS